MTTFGLVPDLKFVEAVTNICYQGRPRPAAQASIHSRERRKGAKRLGSAEGTQHDSQSNFSPRHEGASLRPGASCKHSQASARGESIRDHRLIACFPRQHMSVTSTNKVRRSPTLGVHH